MSTPLPICCCPHKTDLLATLWRYSYVVCNSWIARNQQHLFIAKTETFWFVQATQCPIQINVPQSFDLLALCIFNTISLPFWEIASGTARKSEEITTFPSYSQRMFNSSKALKYGGWSVRQKFPESGDHLHLNEFQVQKYRPLITPISRYNEESVGCSWRQLRWNNAPQIHRYPNRNWFPKNGVARGWALRIEISTILFHIFTFS